MSSVALQANAFRGAYPERSEPRDGQVDRVAARIVGGAARRWRAWIARSERIVGLVGAQQRSLTWLGDDQIPEVAADLRHRLRREGFQEELIARSFALVREVAGRTLGQRHFNVQLLGGMALLNGTVAEMEAGEGKTLTATLAACTAALAGIPVHVITVNDYLASRDAQWMRPVYEKIGLRVGAVIHGMEPEARRAAYACDVTYCTNKEIVFDYLRDRLVLGSGPGRIRLQVERLDAARSRLSQLVLRGLYYAIVDEADSVLIDEARTPLIIAASTEHPAEQETCRCALSLAQQLAAERDFIIDGPERTVRFTSRGEERLAELATPLGSIWAGPRRREQLVRQALIAQHLFIRDKHYLVADGKVVIIDEYTGRVMPDRSWERGLHQLIEAKEECVLTRPQQTLARISYQRFFRRYLRLAGMTGTAREVAGELWSVYGLAVMSVPTNRPLQRRAHADRVYSSAEAKWQAIVKRIDDFHRTGRPVLVGTRSVAASEHLSQLLTRAGLAHQVLNARQDKEEAEIVARAGERGRITVATNMAGRGTDIQITDDVAKLGGLHVIASERHEAHRVDRQLFGRCGRQGDPGSYEAMISLEDELASVYGGRFWPWLARMASRGRRPATSWMPRFVIRRAQRAAERLHSRVRRDVLKMDEHLDSALAFTGSPE